MDRNGTPTSGPNQLDPQKSVQLPSGEKQNTKTVEFTRARIFLFISLSILILLFSANTLLVSIITTILILLGIGNLFDPISDRILKHCDRLLIFLGKPFEWLWRFLFVKHRTSLGRLLKRHSRLVIDTTAIITIVIVVGTTTLRPFVTATSGHLNDSVCLYTRFPWIACASGFGVTTLPNGVRTGLIADNTYGPFDQSTVNQDEIMVEKLIFKENQHACTGQQEPL